MACPAVPGGGLSPSATAGLDRWSFSTEPGLQTRSFFTFPMETLITAVLRDNRFSLREQARRLNLFLRHFSFSLDKPQPR